MFKAVAFFFLVVVAVAVGFVVFPISEKDKLLFDELLKSSNPDNKEQVLSYSQQKREGVRKEIWYQDDDSPLFFRIDSDESELFFFRQENQVEVVEQLTNVACTMQEELYYDGEKPMQKIRYLEAERACYNYNSQLFIAEDVKLWKYQIEGHTLPSTKENGAPLMSATAHTVEFTLKGKKLDFTAYHMRAHVNSKEGPL